MKFLKILPFVWVLGGMTSLIVGFSGEVLARPKAPARPLQKKTIALTAAPRTFIPPPRDYVPKLTPEERQALKPEFPSYPRWVQVMGGVRFKSDHGSEIYKQISLDPLIGFAEVLPVDSLSVHPTLLPKDSHALQRDLKRIQYKNEILAREKEQLFKILKHRAWTSHFFQVFRLINAKLEILAELDPTTQTTLVATGRPLPKGAVEYYHRDLYQWIAVSEDAQQVVILNQNDEYVTARFEGDPKSWDPQWQESGAQDGLLMQYGSDDGGHINWKGGEIYCLGPDAQEFWHYLLPFCAGDWVVKGAGSTLVVWIQHINTQEWHRLQKDGTWRAEGTTRP